MPAKNIPLSLRITEEDAEFLAKYSAPDATTPSEKMRAILAGERRRAEGLKDYAECAAMVSDLLAPSLSQLRRLHGERDLHSIFAYRLYDWLPELIAMMMTEVPEDENAEEGLKRLERDLADHVFELIEEVLRLGLTSKSRTLDPKLIQDRLPSAFELFELIQLKKGKKNG